MENTCRASRYSTCIMIPTPTSRETHAFSIAELEAALNWNELCRADGYRVSICLDCPGSEELLVVHRPGSGSPAFALRRCSDSVLLIDAMGLTVPFPTVVAALRAMLPIPGPRRHAISHRERPYCIRTLPGFLLTSPRRAWSTCLSSLASLIKTLGRNAALDAPWRR